MPTQTPPTLDTQAAKRWQSVPDAASPWLNEEVARRMEERLEWIKLKPTQWAHWSPLRGGLQAHELLVQRYPAASCFVVENDPVQAPATAKAMSKPWWQPRRWTGSPVRFETPPDSSVQMVWANMGLHMAGDPQALMSQWQRALSVDGFVMFSCLGPDTLHELRGLYQSLGWAPPAHEFTDMHDWGDMLVAAGFAEPVMDMERITLTFQSPQRMLEELRGLGRNLHVSRFPGLRGRQWRQKLLAALDSMPLQMTFEVIYGHAFRPVPKVAMRAETLLPLSQMREALHQRKSYPKDP